MLLALLEDQQTMFSAKKIQLYNTDKMASAKWLSFYLINSNDYEKPSVQTALAFEAEDTLDLKSGSLS
ncbi:MAG TPA: hypothetical protein V6C98_05155 [Thermosynechococcaceae cyanobacterium]